MGSLICFSLCMCAGEYCLFGSSIATVPVKSKNNSKVEGIARTKPTGVGAAKKKT